MDRLTLTQSDSVSQALRSLDVQSSVFCSSSLRAPWGFRVERSSVAKFHLVLAGCCWLQLGDREAVALGPGDLVLFPSGDAHSLSDGTQLPRVSAERAP